MSAQPLTPQQEKQLWVLGLVSVHKGQRTAECSVLVQLCELSEQHCTRGCYRIIIVPIVSTLLETSSDVRTLSDQG